MKEQRKSVVSIDITKIKTVKELHLLLKERLEFPDYYGENWDAFWDCILDPNAMPEELMLVGWSELEKTLPSDGESMKECLLEYNEELPEWKCKFFFN
ncbi:barstar family protein [Domibacillus epiphyticus]|uniref:Barnase inhibitor n=1 Tax=Domibacillus epiphyticus TaxID=1714355 RepID=A0A1V2ACI7_9BACI|nr:barstar family protein [Domibacillus epiphyticus]OMP68708.1 barnase inhibitor [Domibacillus epiphyticus]